jgi:vancomycin resistance protein YoaR
VAALLLITALWIACLAPVRRAAAGEPRTPAPPDLPVPEQAYRFVLARFQTPIVNLAPGRMHNIALAASRIDGRVLQPGEVFSFNDVVGPRDPAHGWALADEIYQGEYVPGYGGGICQVTSTLYNAALLAGLTIVERYHHDRPLQYISPGRDATVVWGQLDFRFRNSLDRPVQIRARVTPEDPPRVEVTLHGDRPSAGDPIRLEEEYVRFTPPELVEVEDPGLPRGRRVVEDEGYFGVEVRIYRVMGLGPEARRELVSHDVYPPRPGRVRVGTAE